MACWADSYQIEIVQKSVCDLLEMKILAVRRKELSVKFAKKAIKHPTHHTWFVKNPEDNTSRLKKPTYKPVCTITDRFKSSAIPYLNNLLNEIK